MQYDHQEIRDYLKESEFENLFTQTLGWEEYRTQPLPIVVDETQFVLTPIAQKRGMAVYHWPQTESEHQFPDYATRRKIQKQVAKISYENFIIYTNVDKSTQIWQWVKKQQGKPDACREHRYENSQSGESLIQKLQSIVVPLEQDEELTLFGVLGQVYAGFDVEKVTKKFYDHFKKEHEAFLKFLTGIPNADMQKWYASVMLNRLMFIYFIQKKGFLDSDINYLQTKLTETQNNSTDKYYKEFLCPLFFNGFAKPENERTQETKQLLGKVPYLNGGIFLKHQLEKLHGETIEIPDAAFKKLFNFFEKYQWHLDDRPLKNDNEINPDVLGYIFEKYINQKQMGAYYTKEDITEYISKNTIVPSLFDAAHKKCKIAFEGDTSVWKLLQENPDRYIYDAVKKGTDLELPEEIAAGIDDVSKRTEWNTLAPEEFALPTEIWRETVARQQRYRTIKSKMENGEINNINDLITYNLNIRQFAQDVIENCEGPELLRAFWKAITKVTILDPTCGSGAFLFAALNVLEPLYEACLDRMQIFLNDLPPHVPGVENTPKKPQPQKYKDFREELERIKQHPNQKYFILKSIIINNLYGVDIMDEAIEICKLRLFLKMVAQLDDVKKIEPLPDIDFNIQAGNTLVGFATYDEVEKAVTAKLESQYLDTMESIEEKAEGVKHLFQNFQDQQTKFGGEVKLEDKQELQKRLMKLEDELNEYLANEYKVDPNKEPDYENWKKSHNPFHWFITFYGILQDGGFDVIIGNPPYVSYSKIRNEYTIRGYKTEKCRNLYAYVFERCFDLLKSNGWKSMIIPNSAYCTDTMAPLQDLFSRSIGIGWLQTYGERPAQLFVGARPSCAIYIIRHGLHRNRVLYSSRLNRWHEQFRINLFSLLEHTEMTKIEYKSSIPQIYCEIEKSIWSKISNFSILGNLIVGRPTTHEIYYHNAALYWIRSVDFVPYFWNERDGEQRSTHLKPLHFTSESDATVAMTILNCSLFYWWYLILSNCRDVSSREIKNFPCGIGAMDESTKDILCELATELMRDLQSNSQRKEIRGNIVGRVVYDEFFPRYSKHIIDEIDRVLAQHYGFTDEEFDFIINYDIKYRMGLGN